jgi:hypothetical protein
VPLAARVRSKALCTCRAVRRALRIYTSSPGTARGSVCDNHQRDAAEATQLEQDKQDTQCVVAVWAGLAICGGVAVCAELSLIRVTVAAMSIQKIARDLTSKASKKWQIHISRRSRRHETQAARVKSDASVHSACAIGRTPHRKASIILPARTCFQRAARCAR